MEKEVRVKVSQASASLSHGTIEYSNSQYPIDRPVEAGGSGAGALGGEIWLVGLGGCFMSTLLAEVRERNADIDEVEINTIGTHSEELRRFTKIQLVVTANYEDKELFETLIRDSRIKCLVMNSMSSEIELNIKLED